MFKSIFKNLLVTYLTIFITVIATLSLILSVLYSRHIFSEKRTSLENAAYKINLLANDYYKNRISIKEMDSSLDSMGYITDSKIYLVKLNRQSLDSSQTLKIGEGLEENYLLGDLRKIMNGKTVFRQKQYSDKFDMYMVFTGVPWKTDKGIEGAILLFSPVNHVTDNIARINLVIWLTALFFIVFSTITIYFNSRRISQPVKEIEKAAISLATGENAQDLPVNSQDEIGRLSRTFNYMKNKLLETEKMRRDFIANVSHDLRTPLTSINGFVEGILDGLVKPEEIKKYLTIVQSETNRLMRLTSDILQLAKIQSGGIAVSKEKLNAWETVNSVIESVKSLSDEKGINFSFNCRDSVFVMADSDKLKQILINIMGNAVQYSPDGGQISINVEDSDSKIRFAISDNGIGIPDDDLPFIFEKFYRVDKSRQSAKGGTGLGLNIAKSLVELHGGSIWASSEPGKGTEIVFELPKE